MSKLNKDVFDNKTIRMIDDVIDSKIKRLWFQNYEANKGLIKESKKLTDIPLVDSAIVVGAGWSLSQNAAHLAETDIPVIVCDKAADFISQFVTPFAVAALNTEETEVGAWLLKFKNSMEKSGRSLDDVWFIVPVTVNPEVFKVWTGKKIAFVNADNTCPELVTLVQAETGIEPTLRGDNVGFFAVITAVTLGAKVISMIGMNYCYESKGEALEATNGYSYVMLRDVRDVEVYTTLDWLHLRAQFINFCMAMIEQANVRFINCSEGGILYEVGVVRDGDFKSWLAMMKRQQS
jgi:hypothetical protein